MVCMDGFILTHAVEGIDVPEQVDVDAFLPPYEPRQVLDPTNPVSIGAMVGPEAFTEVRYLSHLRQLDALELIPALAVEFESAFGRESGGLLHSYRTEDATTIVVALGSVLGTIKDAVDQRREAARVGVVGITTFRPFPFDEVRRALANAEGRRRGEGLQRRAYGGVLSADVAIGDARRGRSRCTPSSPASAVARSPSVRSRRSSTTRARPTAPSRS
jgi:pyruvate ferredoxin oxidoreductase alpha subunit